MRNQSVLSHVKQFAVYMHFYNVFITLTHSFYQHALKILEYFLLVIWSYDVLVVVCVI